MLTDGQIHNSVLAAIIIDYMDSGYFDLSMTNTLVYYNKKNIFGGWGYCDLYDIETGEVWELKKNTSSYTCTTKYAKKQLGKYVNGRLKKYPKLKLSRGGDLVFGSHTYTVRDMNGSYTITYWQERQGILRYSYTFQKNYNNRYQAEQAARLNCILVAGSILIAGFAFTCTGGAASIIPMASIFVQQAA